MNRWRRRIRVLTRRAAVEEELDEEFAFHLKMATEQNLRGGMSPAEARREAMIAFGAKEKHREEVRDARWANPLIGISGDCRFALRMLVKHPGLSLIGGLGMALAIALAIGFYAWMTGFFYSSPPLHEGERIVAVENMNVSNDDDWRAHLFDYHNWRERLGSVQELAAFRTTGHHLVVAGGPARQVPVAEMTASGFSVARVPPLLGRPILAADEDDGAAAVVVLGFEEWRRDFGADPAIIGRELRLSGAPHTIVGVMPEGFRFPVNHGFWTALPTRSAAPAPGEGPRLVIFGRLAPGVARSTAQAELSVIGQAMAAEAPDTHQHLRPAVVPYVRSLVDLQQYPGWLVWLMQLLAGSLLLVVAVNVAVLVYARTASRVAEITVRMALGATRRRIVMQLFLEALVLATLAAGVGLLIARAVLRQILSLAPTAAIPYWIDGRLPVSTIAYAVGLAALAAFVVGVLPALQATGRHLQATLRQMGGASGLRMGTTWTALIIVQVAIAVAVLPLVVGVAWNLAWARPVHPTFSAEQLLAFRVTPESPAGLEGIRAAAGEPQDPGAGPQTELIRRVAAEPGVSRVSYAAGIPLSAPRVRLEVEGGIHRVDGARGRVRLERVGGDYFGVFGLPLLAGRYFDDADAAGSRTSLIVSRAFVQQFLGGGDVLGRRVRILPEGDADGHGEARWYEIVGVVEDMYVVRNRHGGTEPAIYQPLGIAGEPLSVVARLRGTDQEEIALRLREIAHQVAPGHLLSLTPPSALRGGPGAREVLVTSLLVGLITLSVLLLSAAGVYALMSFAVSRRQREIGIRSALGASRGRIVWSIFSHSSWQLALGIAVGATAMGGLDWLTGGALLNQQGAILLPLVAVLMTVSGLVAAVGPARRALRIQPMEALRQE